MKRVGIALLVCLLALLGGCWEPDLQITGGGAPALPTVDTSSIDPYVTIERKELIVRPREYPIAILLEGTAKQDLGTGMHIKVERYLYDFRPSDNRDRRVLVDTVPSRIAGDGGVIEVGDPVCITIDLVIAVDIAVNARAMTRAGDIAVNARAMTRAGRLVVKVGRWIDRPDT